MSSRSTRAARNRGRRVGSWGRRGRRGSARRIAPRRTRPLDRRNRPRWRWHCSRCSLHPRGSHHRRRVEGRALEPGTPAAEAPAPAPRRNHCTRSRRRKAARSRGRRGSSSGPPCSSGAPSTRRRRNQVARLRGNSERWRPAASRRNECRSDSRPRRTEASWGTARARAMAGGRL